MDRFAVNEVTTFRWSLEQDLEEYRRADAAAIGVWRQKLSDVGDEVAVRLIRGSGLKVSSLSWAGGFTGSDGRGHAESVEDAREAIHLAAVLEADCLMLHTGARGGHTHNHVRRLFRSALEKLLPAAEAAGVVLALEPMCTPCGQDFTFLADLDEVERLLAEFGSPSLRVALDSYHLGDCPDLLERLPKLAEKTVLVQLGDRRTPADCDHNRCALGEGLLPLAAVVQTLEAAGYRGVYELELMGEEVETTCYRQLMSDCRASLADWLKSGERRPAFTSAP